MQIDSHSKLAKWAYFTIDVGFSSYNVPGRTTLCAFFWRSVLLTPLKLALLLAAVGAAVGAVFVVPVMKVGWLGIFIMPGLVAGVAGLNILISYIRDGREGREKKEPGVLIQGFKAIKSKYCPIITFNN